MKAWPDWQPHIRSKGKRRKLAKRFKDDNDPIRIVIVCGMAALVQAESLCADWAMS